MTCFSIAIAFLIASTAGAQGLTSAKADAHAGRVDSAIASIGSSRSAAAQSLLCALYESEDQRDRAIAACEAAAAASPDNSAYALELARAYGEKADHSGALTGLRMVGKIRSAFERSVQLDGRNVEALSDLGQFYVEAPGMVGGGVDKARELVARLQPLSSARAHRLTAMIAAKTHEDATAEAEYKAAIAASHSAESYVDLAKYYRSHEQYQAAEQAARAAIDEDKQHGPDTLDAAVILLDMHRSVPTAQAALRNYLSTPQVGVAAYAKAHTLLGDSLKAEGDSNAAQAEYAAALSLARDYEPARKAAGK